mmetsp:Transcript_7377/g.11206  ORF Transcript_7377/g.11206 Transcript_7377/m.11206 type:complete len:105 (+) Transcript_7377:229-543(+)
MRPVIGITSFFFLAQPTTSTARPLTWSTVSVIIPLCCLLPRGAERLPIAEVCALIHVAMHRRPLKPKFRNAFKFCQGRGAQGGQTTGTADRTPLCQFGAVSATH